MVNKEVFKSRQICPCGKGESEQIGRSGDARDQHLMLCPDCKEKYVYDPTGVCRNHKIRMRPRGWVLKRNHDHSGTFAGSY